jgi:hypothetical protein
MMALAEAQAWGLNPQDKHDELMDFIELRWLLWDIEADRAVEANRLCFHGEGCVLGSREYGYALSPEDPQDPCMTGDVLGAVDVIQERVKGAYDSGHDPWD